MWETASSGMENYCLLDKIKLNDNQYGELLLELWHDRVKLSENRYGELLFQLWHSGQDKTEWWSVWRITISVLTLDKMKLNVNQCGELLFQLWHWTRWNWTRRYGELLFQLWHWTRWVWMTISVENCYFSCDTGQDETEWRLVWRITISVVAMDKMKLNDD